MEILGNIRLPYDIKKLNIDQMEKLAGDIREEILTTTYKNGGHLSSNLGIVETTIALYKTFDFPKDKLIFDVGHQCYAHKILSGRLNDFESIRTYKGLSGFPDINESEYDSFGVGHAGTSLSAGIGYCSARDKLNEDYTVVAVVGDGAFTNGLNLEALTVSDKKPKNFIVIYNDNGMSISKNKTGLYTFLSKETTKKSYVTSKRHLQKIFGNSFVTKMLTSFRDFIKRLLNKDSYFEHYGFKYVGILDGNNLKELTKIMERVKEVAKDKAVFLHVKTTKGKGYEQAEEHADMYHGVGKNLTCESGSFSSALGDKLNSLIENDDKIIGITAAMKDGTGLKKVEEIHPDNFVDVGIAEEYAVTYAGGLAIGGLKPFVCVYSTFLQRSYDQVIHDICIQNLPVIFCIDRAGLSGRDGKTHQGVFDISFLSHIPNMTIIAPNDGFELNDAVDYALKLNSPVAIRYPKNVGTVEKEESIEDNPWRKVKDGNKVTILAVGPNMLDIGRKICEKFDNVGLYSVRVVKPLCKDVLDKIKDTTIITMEENSVKGGFGSLVSEYYRENRVWNKVINLGVKDKFIAHGSISDQLKENQLTEENITGIIKEFI